MSVSSSSGIPRLKVGDIVVNLGDNHHWVRQGAIGIIAQPHIDTCHYINWEKIYSQEDHEGDEEFNSWYRLEKNLEKIGEI